MRLAEETYQDETEHSPSGSFTQFQGEIGGGFSLILILHHMVLS